MLRGGKNLTVCDVERISKSIYDARLEIYEAQAAFNRLARAQKETKNNARENRSQKKALLDQFVTSRLKETNKVDGVLCLLKLIKHSRAHLS